MASAEFSQHPCESLKFHARRETKIGSLVLLFQYPQDSGQRAVRLYRIRRQWKIDCALINSLAYRQVLQDGHRLVLDVVGPPSRRMLDHMQANIDMLGEYLKRRIVAQEEIFLEWQSDR